MWLGRTVVVHQPPAATIQNAVLLRARPGDIVTLLGAPFRMWHTTNLLEGSFVVPAVSDATDDTAESEGTLAHLGPVHVPRCSYRVPGTRTLRIEADTRPHTKNKKKKAPTTVAMTTRR